MAETSGQTREGGEGKVNLESDADSKKIEIGRNYLAEKGGDGGDEAGEAIEMRTARDAKAVPPPPAGGGGGGGGAGEPLEHHLTRDQLANLTLERRIKVVHTNLTPKLVILHTALTTIF